jgi:hypothetical protein
MMRDGTRQGRVSHNSSVSGTNWLCKDVVDSGTQFSIGSMALARLHQTPDAPGQSELIVEGVVKIS